MYLVNTDAAPAAVGPYAQAIIHGDVVYTAGQIPLDPATGALVAGDAAVQCAQVMRNLTAVLDAAGSSLDAVIKATIFLTDLADFDAVNEVYARYLGAHRPARSTVQVAALPRGARVEIELIAAIRSAR